MSSAAARTWRVGQLATDSGISVRTLRHYDQIGLLAPSARRGTGPRVYTANDVARLRHILALRGLGLPLADIDALLDGTMSTLRDLLTRQLHLLEQHLADQQQVRRVLHAVLDSLDDAGAVGPEGLTARIKQMTTLVGQLTPAQVRNLETGRRRMMAELSDVARTGLVRRRRDAMARLSPEQYRALTDKRSALMPPGPQHSVGPESE